MSRYLTVVYKIEDAEAFKPQMEKLRDQMLGPCDGAEVSAMSMDHEVHRLELIEQAVSQRVDDLPAVIDDITSRTGIHLFKDISEILDA